MIVFWLTCAVLVAIALAFVIPPLLQSARKDPEHSDTEANIDVYRDQISELDADLQNGLISQEQYQHDRDEIERRLLDDVSIADPPVRKKSEKAAGGRSLVYAIALGIPVIAIALYVRIGNPGALSASSASSTAATRSSAGGPALPMGDGQMSQQQIEKNVESLAQRLQENPADPAGWTMLGRSYITLEKYSEASNAYAKATTLKPDDADLWADYAFAMGMANGRRLQGQPQELINRALQLDPENPKALELAGSAAFEAKNYGDAIKYWQRLQEKAPRNSELALALQERIDQAKSLLDKEK
jgi:cytochrome c-type biogenesis protein CcmH